MDYNSDSDLQKGDILVSLDHIEIYTENGKVFSCGSNKSMRELEVNKSINAGQGNKIIRVK